MLSEALRCFLDEFTQDGHEYDYRKRVEDEGDAILVFAAAAREILEQTWELDKGGKQALDERTAILCRVLLELSKGNDAQTIKFGR